MHLTEGELRAYLDHELPGGQQSAARQHLGACRQCQAAAEAVRAQAGFVHSRLAALPEPEQAAWRPDARQRLERRLAATPPVTFKEKLTMFKHSLSRPAWAAITLIAVLALALAFPPVRALANDFLGLFRVQRIQALPVNSQHLDGQLGASPNLEALFQNGVTYHSNGKAQTVPDLASAARLVAFPPRLPAAWQDAKLYVQPGGSLSLTLDVKLINGILHDLNHGQVQLADGLNGQKLNVTVPAGLVGLSGRCPQQMRSLENSGRDRSDGPAEQADQASFDEEAPANDCAVLMQMPSPTVEAPQGLDVAQLGQVYLELLGMEPEKAQQFSRNTDWTSTLIVPVPTDLADYQTLPVDGVEGTFIHNYSYGRKGYLLLWVKDGILYTLAGPGSSDLAADLANSLR